MSGKTIPLHSDGAQSVTLVYEPEDTEEIQLICTWIRDTAVLMMSEDELETLATKLGKAVKKVRKLKAKQTKEPALQIERFYWENAEDFSPDDPHPYGERTAQVVDLEAGGVIAYCHTANAHRLVMALRSATTKSDYKLL